MWQWVKNKARNAWQMLVDEKTAITDFLTTNLKAENAIGKSFQRHLRGSISFIYGNADGDGKVFGITYIAEPQKLRQGDLLNRKWLRVLNPLHFANLSLEFLRAGFLGGIDRLDRRIYGVKNETEVSPPSPSSLAAIYAKKIVNFFSQYLIRPFVSMPLKLAGDLADFVFFDRASEFVNFLGRCCGIGVVEDPVTVVHIQPPPARDNNQVQFSSLASPAATVGGDHLMSPRNQTVSVSSARSSVSPPGSPPYGPVVSSSSPNRASGSIRFDSKREKSPIEDRRRSGKGHIPTPAELELSRQQVNSERRRSEYVPGWVRPKTPVSKEQKQQKQQAEVKLPVSAPLRTKSSHSLTRSSEPVKRKHLRAPSKSFRYRERRDIMDKFLMSSEGFSTSSSIMFAPRSKHEKRSSLVFSNTSTTVGSLSMTLANE